MKLSENISTFIYAVIVFIGFILKMTLSLMICGIPLVLLLVWCFPDYIHIINKEITDKTIVNLVENKRFDEAIWLIEKKENSINSFSKSSYLKIKGYETEAQMSVGNFKATEKCIEKMDSIINLYKGSDESYYIQEFFFDIQKSRLFFKMNNHEKIQEICQKYYFSPEVFEKRYIEIFSKGDYDKDEIMELSKTVINQLKLIYIRSVSTTDYDKGRELFKHELSISNKDLQRMIDLYMNYSMSALRVDSICDAKEGYEYMKSVLDKHKHALNSFTPNFLINYVELVSLFGEKSKISEILPIIENSINNNFSDNELSYYEATSKCIKYWDQEGMYEKSLETLEKQSSFFRNMLNRNFLFYGERQRENIYYMYRPALEASFAHLYFDNSKKAAEIAYNNALFVKGLLLRSSEQLLKAVESSGDSNLKLLYEDMLSMKKQLIEYEVLGGIINKYKYSKLKGKIEDIEEKLSKACYKYRIIENQNKYDYDDVRKKLDKNEACIEFIMDGNGFYYALVGRYDYDYPRIIKLFSEEDLVKLMDSNIYDEYLFSDKLLGGIMYHLKDIDKVYYSPVGELYRISLDALPYKNSNVFDYYDFVMVSSTSDIKNNDIFSYKTATLMGDIRYSATDSLIMAHSKASVRGIKHNNFLMPLGNEEVLEVRDMLIEKGLKVDLYTRLDASEDMLKSLSGKSTDIIHLSTHGFYDPSYSSYPMRNSGIFLAGANRKWFYNYDVKTEEDGIITADEISLLNLTGCSLAVLSACETGLGNIDNSEGVFGLQRAFKLAGVKSLILSLWKVNNDATTLLMTSFYNEWIKTNNMNVAFRKAKTIVKEKYPESYYWAGFVLIDGN